jgi:hypothetical protein
VHLTANNTWAILPQVKNITVENSAVMYVEAPVENASVGQRFEVRGWAIDRAAATGSGVDQVTVTAHPTGGGSPVFIGYATAQLPRQYVADIFGPQFVNSGFTLAVTTPVPAGQYRLDVSARSTVTNTFNQTFSRNIVVQSDPHGWLDAPAHNTTTGQPFLVGGWMIDRAAATGTGILTIHVWGVPVGGGTPIFLGVPTFGARPDVAALFGAQFLNSGFTLAAAAGLPPGTWQVVAFGMSSVTGNFTQSVGVTVNIPTPNVYVSIDAPGANAVVGQPFHIGGWAVDFASPNTVNVAAVHVYAYPASGAPTFLGAALVTHPRPDVAAAYGAHYYYSGWGLNTTGGLSPGTYTIVAYPISAANQAVPGAAWRVVTVQ